MSYSNIKSRMVQETDLDCVDTALDYLNEFVDSGMDYADALFKVTEHFSEVDEDELAEAYDDQ